LAPVFGGALTEAQAEEWRQRIARLPQRYAAQEKVVFAFEASAFHTDRSGRVEVRLRTPSAARIVELCGAPLAR